MVQKQLCDTFVFPVASGSIQLVLVHLADAQLDFGLWLNFIMFFNLLLSSFKGVANLPGGGDHC